MSILGVYARNGFPTLLCYSTHFAPEATAQRSVFRDELGWLEMLQVCSRSQVPSGLSSARSRAGPNAISLKTGIQVYLFDLPCHGIHSVERAKPYLVLGPRTLLDTFCRTQALHILRQRPLRNLIRPCDELHQ